MARLGDLCRFINGDRGKNYPSQADIRANGEIPFINAGHLVDGKIDFSEMNYISQKKFEQLNSGKIQENDILYCLRGSLGKKAIVKGIHKGAIASSLVIIRPDIQKLNSDYLFYALESPTVQEQMMQANNGSSQPNLSAKSVSDYTFNLPGINEQLGIVSKLTKVNELIALRKEQLTKLEQLVKSRFIELFGDPILNQYGWRKMPLEENATLLNGRAYKQDELLDSGKYPVLRVGNFFSNRGWYYSDLELDEDKYCDNGDLLYAWSASFGPQIWNGGKVIYHYHIWKVLVGGAYNKQFLCKLLEYATESLMGDTHGIAMMHLTKSGMEKTEFIVPPIDLQEQFATFVEQTDKSKAEIKKRLEQLETLKKALMQKYFG